MRTRSFPGHPQRTCLLAPDTSTSMWQPAPGGVLAPQHGDTYCIGSFAAVNEDVIRSTADKLIELGLRDAGYVYLNIDDCWHQRLRSASGELQVDTSKFPSGMAKLGEDLHSKGFKFGIYSDAGLLTCGGYPGSLGHEGRDAKLFASWGVDYLKYDNCFASAADVQQRYRAMRDALNATGRPIVYSMCDWGVGQPWRWGADTGNSWRIDMDIAAGWDSVLRSLDSAIGLARFAGPGGWNDPDMLEVGNGQLSLPEQRSHFALWCLLKSPLLIGTNLSSISTASASILRSPELLAVHQDPLGSAGDLLWKEGNLEVWAAALEGGARAVVLFNRHFTGEATSITVDWSRLGWPQEQQATVRDLHQAKDVGTFSSSFSGLVMPRDVLPLRISPTSGPSAQGSREGSLQGTGSAGRSVSDDGWRPWHGNEYIQRHAKRRSSGEVEAAVRASRAARMRRAVEGAAASVY